MRRFLIVLFACCLVVPARLNAQTAADFVARGDASRLKFDSDKAIADYTKALEIDPKNALAYRRRGGLWGGKGEQDKAIADYDKALAIDPKAARVYVLRGIAWEDKGEYDKAISDYTKAAAIDPKEDEAYYSLSSIYASCPDAKYRDGKKAIESASKAVPLSAYKRLVYLDTLGAAYAESGDFAKAQEFQVKAIELAPEIIKPEFRSRLELYKQGKPYHEPPVKK